MQKFLQGMSDLLRFWAGIIVITLLHIFTLVCTLYLVCTSQSAFYTRSTFYPWSAVCILQSALYTDQNSMYKGCNFHESFSEGIL